MLAPRADFHWQSERITLFRLACHAWAVKIDGEMSRYHLVRVGAMGQVGRFAAVDAVRYPRRSRVIVRTRRGLELGDVTSELEAYTERLAETYEAKVQFRKFTETLIEGCGPGCGTDEAKGRGGCDSCTSCAVAGACGTKR